MLFYFLLRFCSLHQLHTQRPLHPHTPLYYPLSRHLFTLRHISPPSMRLRASTSDVLPVGSSVGHLSMVSHPSRLAWSTPIYVSARSRRRPTWSAIATCARCRSLDCLVPAWLGRGGLGWMTCRLPSSTALSVLSTSVRIADWCTISRACLRVTPSFIYQTRYVQKTDRQTERQKDRQTDTQTVVLWLCGQDVRLLRSRTSVLSLVRAIIMYLSLDQIGPHFASSR